ncbi:MAG: histidine kinase, partial [Bacteroides sp.]|nr:histidine kinase [Bacteroides sp.]
KLLQEQLRLRRVISTTLLIIVFVILVISTWYMNRMRKINKRLRYSEKETKEATERTEKANEEKSLFLSNMSHAIRVPLNSVVGFAQLLVSDEELSEEERNEYAQITQTESDKLMRLVNNVLDL